MSGQDVSIWLHGRPQLFLLFDGIDTNNAQFLGGLLKIFVAVDFVPPPDSVM